MCYKTLLLTFPSSTVIFSVLSFAFIFLSAAHSLVLTTTVPGLGLRRTPSSQSLLHALVALVLHETELITGTHDLTVLNIACCVLFNACHVPECRTALTKVRKVF